MNYRIINTYALTPDILLYRNRDEEGIELVVIMAIGIIDKLDDMFASEIIEFENSTSAQCFITDYTKESADKWCRHHKIKY
jgi:hypothetical protein